MTRISQLISVVGGVKADTVRKVREAVSAVSAPGATEGFTKAHTPLAEPESGQPPQALPPQGKNVQATAEGALASVAGDMTRFLDVTLTLDSANAGARADLEVDGHVLVRDVPVGHLIFLERELGALHDLVSGLPTLDPSVEWHTAGQESGVWRSAPVETRSTAKGYVNHVVSPAQVIDGHPFPPQVQVMPRDEVTGTWVSTRFSGALDPGRKRAVLDRITAVREAVKYAREEANSAQVEDRTEGSAIFGWILR